METRPVAKKTLAPLFRISDDHTFLHAVALLHEVYCLAKGESHERIALRTRYRRGFWPFLSEIGACK